jgi:hypothetical protein
MVLKNSSNVQLYERPSTTRFEQIRIVLCLLSTSVIKYPIRPATHPTSTPFSAKAT